MVLRQISTSRCELEIMEAVGTVETLPLTVLILLHDLPEPQVRHCIWRLIDQGNLVLTNDRKLKRGERKDDTDSRTISC